MALFSANGLGVLRHRNFSLYLSARLLSALAVNMQSVAIGWQVYAVTGNVYDLGLIGLAQFAPFFLLILPAGHVADRYNRRTVITFCFGLQLVCGMLLFLLSWSGLKSIWPVLGVLSLYGSARAFMMPASQAILINLVPAESFGKAVALNSSIFHAAVIAGPTLGGLLYLAGPTTVYVTVGILLAVSICLMLATRMPPQQVRREPASWHTLLEGLRFVWSRPVILGAISLDLFAVLFGGATALLPAFARDVLHAGPAMLGLLRTAPAIGAVAISVALAFWPITRRVGYWMFGGVAVFGAGTIVLGATRDATVALLALFLMGAGDMVSVYIRHILVQVETPDAIRGRVSAVNAVFIGASNELGEFESGVTASWFGLVRALMLGGVATLVVTLTWMWRFPVLAKMNRFPHTQDKPS